MALGKIKADTLEHSTAGSLDTQYVVNGSAKAWVTHASASIQDSINVSSITDISGGTQQIFFSNSMANTTYIIAGLVGNNNDSASNTMNSQRPYLWATASYRSRTLYNSGAGVAADYDHTDNMVMGDLA
jgi:hypothetical protein